MKLISNRMLREFAERHMGAERPLQAWRRLIEHNEFADFAALKQLFGAVDKVGDKVVFDIAGNRFRLIAHLSFQRQIVYVKAVLTHEQYDRGGWS